MDIEKILDDIKELIECSGLSPDEIKRAITREMNLKNATKESSKKKRMTKRAKFEKEIKETISLSTGISGFPLSNFENIVNRVLDYAKLNLSDTSLWRLKTNIVHWLHEKYPENANDLAYKLHLFEYYTTLHRQLRN